MKPYNIKGLCQYARHRLARVKMLAEPRPGPIPIPSFSLLHAEKRDLDSLVPRPKSPRGEGSGDIGTVVRARDLKQL